MITVVGQKIFLGHTHQYQTVTVLVAETTLTVEFGDGDARVSRRTTTQPVRPAAADRYSHFLDHLSHINWQNRVAHQPSDHSGGLLTSTVS